MTVGLSRRDALCRPKWILGVNHIAAGWRGIGPTSLVGDPTGLLLGGGESGHLHLLGILPDCSWVEGNRATFTCWGSNRIAAGWRGIGPPSLVGDPTGLLMGGGESGQLHLLGILPDCCWVEGNRATFTCWGSYRIAAGWRGIGPPSLVGDPTGLQLGGGESGHLHLLGILPDCCWVEGNRATFTCWGSYHIAAGWRGIGPPSLVGDPTRLLLVGGESGHLHLLGILPNCC